ncbi:MAG: thiamine pyrophosphate-dependent enzyme [Rikenellaceae bacterium]|nr:thiamine pyrophosphate-dependent enzyme [Rikenellaceae bacterium]
MAKKIADQLVDMLHEAGVERIYAVTGDSLNPVNDAVRRHKNVKWVHVRHEETGAYAAGAEAQLNGIACCAGSCGPGHVHLINGLYDAHRTGCAVLAIASAIPSGEMGTKYFQETSPAKLFADCSGYNEMALTQEQLPRMLQGALQHAVGRQEVAVIGLPGDLAQKHATDPLSSQKTYATAAHTVPSADALARFAAMVDSSRKTVIFCGIGARNAHAEVVEFARKAKAPVAYTFKSKMAIQYDNPYEIGMTGLLGLPAAYEAMHDAELLVMLGTDFPYDPFLPTKCPIVQVDIRPERLGRRAKVELGIEGDVKDTLTALLPLIKEQNDTTFLEKQLLDYRHHAGIMAKEAEIKGREDRIAPEFAATLIDRYAARDAIFTVDTGMCCVWGARYLTATGKREMIGSFNHGSMANAMPQAIGAAMARPGQQVVALCGDGGLSMLLGDLATIVQYKLPVKLFVFNNRALGMVKLEMEVAGFPDWQTDMYNPDFAKVAEAMGMPGVTVHDPSQVETAVRSAFDIDGPVLIELMTDPDSLALPPHIEYSQVKGFAEAMAKIMLSGNIGEVWDTIRSNTKHLPEIV